MQGVSRLPHEDDPPTLDFGSDVSDAGLYFGAVLPILLLFDCQELREDLEWR